MTAVAGAAVFAGFGVVAVEVDFVRAGVVACVLDAADVGAELPVAEVDDCEVLPVDEP